jgi:hypothetical protein
MLALKQYTDFLGYDPSLKYIVGGLWLRYIAQMTRNSCEVVDWIKTFKDLENTHVAVGNTASKYVGTVRPKMANSNWLLHRNGSVQGKGVKSMGITGLRVFRR